MISKSLFFLYFLNFSRTPFSVQMTTTLTLKRTGRKSFAYVQPKLKELPFYSQTPPMPSKVPPIYLRFPSLPHSPSSLTRRFSCGTEHLREDPRPAAVRYNVTVEKAVKVPRICRYKDVLHTETDDL